MVRMLKSKSSVSAGICGLKLGNAGLWRVSRMCREWTAPGRAFLITHVWIRAETSWHACACTHTYTCTLTVRKQVAVSHRNHNNQYKAWPWTLSRCPASIYKEENNRENEQKWRNGLLWVTVLGIWHLAFCGFDFQGHYSFHILATLIRTIVLA